MFLLDDILLFPVKGPAWVIKQIIDRAQEELYDPHKVKMELLELQLLYEMDEISEEEYFAREAELLERLREIREYEMARRGV